MNTLETRLTRELHDVALEIDVTEEELKHAEHRFLRRSRAQARRRRSQVVTGAAAASVLLVAGGAVLVQELVPQSDPVAPATTQPEPEPLPLTVSNIAGVWMVTDSSGWLHAFQADGQLVFLNPGDPTTGTVQPVPFTLTATGYTLPANLCDFGATLDPSGLMTRTVARIPGQPLRVDGLQGHCNKELGERDMLVKVSPRTPAGASVGSLLEVPDEGTGPVRWASELEGVWLRQGTGTLLMVTRDASEGLVYRLDDDGDLYDRPDDVGTVSLEDSALTLVSSSGSPGCVEGSTVILSDLLQWHHADLPMRQAMHGTSTSGDCDQHDDLAGIWLRVS